MSAQDRAHRGGAAGGFNRTRAVGMASSAALLMEHAGAPLWLLLHRDWGRRGSGEVTEWRPPGGAWRRPDWVMLVGRAAAAMSPAYGRHVAGAGWSKASVSARVERRGGAGPRG